MGINCDIEYCDSSLNIAVGCDGCELWSPVGAEKPVRRCYAGSMTRVYEGKKGWPVKFEQPQIFGDRLKKALAWSDLTGKDRPDKPWLNGYPRIIFLNDMGDSFTESLPEFWLDDYIGEMESSPHIFLVVTKRPGRMFRYFDRTGVSVPRNFWLVTSGTNQQRTDTRVARLLAIPDAPIRGLSYEPAWGPVTLQGVWNAGGLHWVIAGSESGRDAIPYRLDWFRSLIAECASAGVPYFQKQITDFSGRKVTYDRFPEDVKVRQMPAWEVVKKATQGVLDL